MVGLNVVNFSAELAEAVLGDKEVAAVAEREGFVVGEGGVVATEDGVLLVARLAADAGLAGEGLVCGLDGVEGGGGEGRVEARGVHAALADVAFDHVGLEKGGCWHH